MSSAPRDDAEVRDDTMTLDRVGDTGQRGDVESSSGEARGGRSVEAGVGHAARAHTRPRARAIGTGVRMRGGGVAECGPSCLHLPPGWRGVAVGRFRQGAKKQKRPMMAGRAFLVLTGACQFGHGLGGFTTNFIHSEAAHSKGHLPPCCHLARPPFCLPAAVHDGRTTYGVFLRVVMVLRALSSGSFHPPGNRTDNG